MTDGIIFELYQDSDAPLVAELLNRNRFHTARHKKVTAEDYRFTLRSRSYHFIVIARNNGKIVGMASAYPSSDQNVAKEHQVYVGSFLIDQQYRLSYSIVMGIYDMLMDKLKDTDYTEIIATVRPENQASYTLMLKSGFVLLSDQPNDFGRYKLHSFSPALRLFAGAGTTQVNSNTFYACLPVVDKREARKFLPKPILHGKYIECDYKLNGKSVTLLFDIENAKIDGAIAPRRIKIYPDFDTPGQYIIENLQRLKQLHTPYQLVMEPACNKTDETYDLSLEPGTRQVISCPPETKELRFMFDGNWYCFHPNLFVKVTPYKEPMPLTAGNCGNITPWLDPITGFLSIKADEDRIVTLPWPGAAPPYIEGLNTPRDKELLVEPFENGLMITEETDNCRLIRKCTFSHEAGDRPTEINMSVTTSLLCKSDDIPVSPISMVYANKGVQGYTLIAGDKEMKFGANKIRHQGFEYSDYPYWNTEPELFANFPFEKISLQYQTATVDVTIDKRSSPIVHAPIFTSILSFDKEHLPEEQVIEELELSYRMEEK